MAMRAQRTGLAATLALGACLAHTTPAFADKPGPSSVPLHVIAVQTPDAYDQAEALTTALRFAVRAAPGWSLGEGDFSLEVLTLSLKCGDVPDATCQSRIAEHIKTDRYIWGNIQKKGNNVTGKIHLWVRGQGTTSALLDYSDNLTEPNDEALQQIASDAVLALTGGPPKGSVRVHLRGHLPGQVVIDGQPVGALQDGEGTFAFSSGPHRVVVKSPGYVDVESSVVVRPTAVTDVTLSPVPIEAEQPIPWRRVGGFVGIGAGVAFAAVGVVSMAQVSSVQNDKTFTDYAARFPETVDVCDESKKSGSPHASPAVADLCDKASTFTLLQAIVFPLAAVSAGAGTYLLLTSGDSTSDAAPRQRESALRAPGSVRREASRPPGSVRAGWTVQPHIGAEFSKLSATYRW